MERGSSATMNGNRPVRSTTRVSGGTNAAASSPIPSVGAPPGHRRGSVLRLLGVVLIIASLAWSAPYLSQRWQDEARTYRNVAVAVDLEEWADLAYASGGDLLALLQQIRAAGVNQISLKEPTVGRLEREGYLTLYDPAVGGEPPGDLPFVPAAGRVYLQTTDPQLFAQLALTLPARLSPAAVTAAPPYIELKADAAAVRELRSGFLAADLALAEQLGFAVFLRPANARGVDPELILPQVAPGTVLLFQGQEVLGAPDLIQATAQVMVQRGFVLGLLEDPLQLSLVDQLGLDQLYQALLTEAGNAQAVRVHSFTETELKKLHPDDLIDRSLRGVRDRGIGVLYLKAIPPLPGQHGWATLTEPALRYYQGLIRDLTAQRYVVAAAQPNRVVDWPWAAHAGAVGAMGGLWIIVAALFDQVQLRRRLTGLLLIAPLAVVPLVLLAGRFGGETLMRETASFLVAVAMPCAAMALAAPELVRPGTPIWLRGVFALTVATLTGIAGGMLVGASLAGPYYTLDFGYFRGVKIAHLVPPAFSLLLGVLMVWRAGEGRAMTVESVGDYAVSFARMPITWAAAALIGVAGIAAYVILGRTGHTAGFQVSAIEVALRDLFDVKLLARPRFKEILIGGPALLAMAWLRIGTSGRWAALFPLGLAAASIGQVSVVNSFSHIRTPLLVSLIRSLNGYWVALAVGAMAMAALWLLIRVLGWLNRDA